MTLNRNPIEIKFKPHRNNKRIYEIKQKAKKTIRKQIGIKYKSNRI